MSCKDKTVKQWQVICKKRKLPQCNSYKRKADLCAYIESGSSSPLFESRSCKDWLKKDLTAFCKAAEIRCDAKLTKEQMCKLLSTHFRGEARPVTVTLPPSTTGLPKTFQEFRTKSCDVPREGWLVKDLEIVAKALGILNHSNKRKAELCKMISEYFEQAIIEKRPSASPRPKSRPKSPKKIEFKTTVEDFPADVSRYIGGMMPLRDVLAMCASSNVWGRQVCSTKVFWRNYYQNKLEAIQKADQDIWGDLEFLQLVVMKVHSDLMKEIRKAGTEKTYIILNSPGDDVVYYVPLMVPHHHQQKIAQRSSREHNMKRKTTLPSDTYNKKLVQRLKEILPSIDVFSSIKKPLGGQTNLIAKFERILTYL
jgi:hypothetical protein